LTGAELIAAERLRQTAWEGFDAEHDDTHARGELTTAAACYLWSFTDKAPPSVPGARWPWAQRWWKPADRIRNLVKAGALIAAEIDRLQREHG
jgi:hypothetical protein